MIELGRQLRTADGGVLVAVAQLRDGRRDHGSLGRRRLGLATLFGLGLEQRAAPLLELGELSGELVDQTVALGGSRDELVGVPAGELEGTSRDVTSHPQPLLLLPGDPQRLIEIRHVPFGDVPVVGSRIARGGGQVRRRHHRPEVVAGHLEQREHLLGQIEQEVVRLEEPEDVRGGALRQARHGVDQQLTLGGVEPAHHRDTGVQIDVPIRCGRELEEAHPSLRHLDALDVPVVAIDPARRGTRTEAACGHLGRLRQRAHEVLHGLGILDQLLGGVEQAPRRLDHLAGGHLQVLDALVDLVPGVLSHPRRSPRT